MECIVRPWSFYKELFCKRLLTLQLRSLGVDTLCRHNFENNMLWSIEHNASIIMLFAGMKVLFYEMAAFIFFLFIE